MPKWIKGFPPNVNGSYLVRSKHMDRHVRFDYVNGKWLHRTYGSIYSGVPYFEWWDEYGITETKKVIKINFPKPKTDGQI